MRAALVGLSLALLGAGAAAAHDYAIRGLKIGHPWARPAAKGLNGAAYLDITNAGATAEVLKSIEVPAARKAEIHRSQVQGGIASMRPVAGGLTIPAGGTVTLAPGGDHVMLIGLNQALASGGRIPATLVFQRAGRVQVELTIEASRGAAAPAAAEHKH